MQPKSHLVLIIIGLVFLFLFIFSLFPTTIFSSIDDYLSTFFYIIHGKKVPKEIVVVTIDEYSLRKINQKWPLARSLFAQALAVLDKNEAKVVGIDLVFRGQAQDAKEDEILLQALSDFRGEVVLAYYFENNGPVYPYQPFLEDTHPGFINVPSDTSGLIRKLRVHCTLNGFEDTSWAVKMVSSFYGVTARRQGESLLIGDRRIPVSQGVMSSEGRIIGEERSFLINYLLKIKDFITIPFYNLLTEKIPSGLLRDKMVLIAPTLKIVHDIHHTPLGEMPGVFIQANGIANMMRGEVLEPLPFPLALICYGATLLILGYFMFSFSFLRNVFLSSGILLLLFWMSVGLRFWGWQFPYGEVMVGSLGYLAVGNLYNYLFSLAMILKIKNKMIIDPFSGLYSLRYFYEKVRLDSKGIPHHAQYLVAVYLKGFNFLTKGQEFQRLRDIWERLSAYLLSLSSLWAGYGEEALVGVIDKEKNIKKIREGIETILFEEEVRVEVKIGYIKIFPAFNIRESIPALIKNLEGNQESIVRFTKEMLPLPGQSKSQKESMLSSLYLDTEQRSKELLRKIEKLKEEEKKTQEAYFQLMASLVAAIDARDRYTEGHSERVCQYALLLAEKLNVSPQEKEKIRKAALLHDLGKIGIPDKILYKKDPLTEEEFSIIKEHEIHSAKILEPIEAFKDIAPYIIHHHEDFDGGGYPHHLAGDFIPLGARIIAVADVFDAMISGRPYRGVLSIEAALNELEKMKGKRLDPVLVDMFIKVVKEQNSSSSQG